MSDTMLIRKCNECGAVTAFDMDVNDENRAEMQYGLEVVYEVPKSEMEDHRKNFRRCSCALKASLTPAELATVKRMRAGESVEVRKVKGEWPCVYIYSDGSALVGVPETEEGAFGKTFFDAAAAWNAQVPT